jgi:hypothetical protein
MTTPETATAAPAEVQSPPAERAENPLPRLARVIAQAARFSGDAYASTLASGRPWRASTRTPRYAPIRWLL